MADFASFTEDELELPVEDEIVEDDAIPDEALPDETPGPYNGLASAAATPKVAPSMSARWQVKFSTPEKVMQTNTYAQSFDLATLTPLILGAKDRTTQEHMLQAYLNLGYAAFDEATGQDKWDLQREIYAKVSRYQDLLMPLNTELTEIGEAEFTAGVAEVYAPVDDTPLGAGDEVTWTVEVEGEEAYALEGTINSVEDADGTGYAIVQPSLVDGEDTLRDPESHWLSELSRVAAPQPLTEAAEEVEVEEEAAPVVEAKAKPAPTRTAAAVKTREAASLADEPHETGKYTMQAALTIQPQPEKGQRMAMFTISSHDLPPVITIEPLGPEFWKNLPGKFAQYQVDLPNRIKESKAKPPKFGESGHLPGAKTPTPAPRTITPAPKPEPKVKTPKAKPAPAKAPTARSFDFG